jgi:sialidase-1
METGKAFAKCRLVLLVVTINCICIAGHSEDQISQSDRLQGRLESFLGQPEMTLQRLFDSERFPNIVVTKRGTVVAVFGNRCVRARRSEDGGQTWGPEITIADPGFMGGGTTVEESSGDLLVFVEDHHPPAPLTLYRSRDDAVTWAPEPCVIHPDKNGNTPSMHMNEKGITLLRGPHAGRLIRPSRYYGENNSKDQWSEHYTNAIYSDDAGKTWHTSAPFPENGTGEAALEELSDGTVYYNSRVHWDQRPQNTRRRHAFSRDGGQTWQDFAIVTILPDGTQDRSYGLMGGLTRLPVADRDILIFSNIDTPGSERERATVWASLDGGRTWPVKRLVYEGRSAYSALTAGRPGTASEGHIYLHFEGGPGTSASSVARFNLSWLLEGELTGDGTIPD